MRLVRRCGARRTAHWCGLRAKERCGAFGQTESRRFLLYNAAERRTLCHKIIAEHHIAVRHVELNAVNVFAIFGEGENSAVGLNIYLALLRVFERVTVGVLQTFLAVSQRHTIGVIAKVKNQAKR